MDVEGGLVVEGAVVGVVVGAVVVEGDELAVVAGADVLVPVPPAVVGEDAPATVVVVESVTVDDEDEAVVDDVFDQVLPEGMGGEYWFTMAVS